MPHPSARRLAFAALVTITPPALAGAQLAVGQRDTFQDGSTQGWIVNLLGMGSHPAPPANIETGGPAGDGDRYLRLTSVGGAGAGSRLVALNFNGQWAGDYRAAGVNAISMHARNLGGSDLFLRLLFEDPIAGPPENLALSANPVVLRAGGDWQRVVFPLFGPGGLAPLFGSDLDVLFGRVTLVRIVSSERFENPPAPVAAVLGVDNITASVIPEPSTVVLVAGGALLLAVARVGGRRRASETK